METAFTILSAIGGDGDIIEEALPLWQKLVPYICFSYTLIALWIGAFSRMLPYNSGSKKFSWSLLICLLPFLGAMFTIYTFRSSKYKHIPTLSESKEAKSKADEIAAVEQDKRDKEARESFNPFS